MKFIQIAYCAAASLVALTFVSADHVPAEGVNRTPASLFKRQAAATAAAGSASAAATPTGDNSIADATPAANSTGNNSTADASPKNTPPSDVAGTAAAAAGVTENKDQQADKNKEGEIRRR